MRDLRALDRYRVPGPLWVAGDATCGAFVIPSPVMGDLRVVASAGEGWDHVSISLVNRTPVWAEMEYAKRLFLRPEAAAMQLHVAEAAHVNCHPHCLHLWRPHDAPIPLPPEWMV